MYISKLLYIFCLGHIYDGVSTEATGGNAVDSVRPSVYCFCYVFWVLNQPTHWSWNTRPRLISENNHAQDRRLYRRFHSWARITSTAVLISAAALIDVPFIAKYYAMHRTIRWSSRLFINRINHLILRFAIFLASLVSINLFLVYVMTVARLVSNVKIIGQDQWL